MAHAVKHLHDQNVAHLDLKPGNILLDQYFNMKIADLGCATDCSETAMIDHRKGTKSFMAPEILYLTDGETYDPLKADVYSLGVTLYLMLTGENPKVSENSASTNGNSSFDDDMFDVGHSSCKANCYDMGFPDSLADLLSGMLAWDPEKRYSIDDVINHPWTTSEFSSDIACQAYTELSTKKGMSSQF
mmetsp:Transcript_63912/g.88800  ORF Transcript_63912/g.88800 Transcript_63912/m.88800 type:complete len:188 (+) Transcript_63912:378-941(+)